MPDENEINPATGLPHTVSLGRIFDQIRLAPHEISSLLSSWGAAHEGTPQAELSGKLRAAAQATVNPVSYGATPAPTPVVTPVAQPTPPPAPPSFTFSTPAPTMTVRDASDDTEPHDNAA
jgi:hypothetical protein